MAVLSTTNVGQGIMLFVATEQTKTRTMLDINFVMRAANYIKLYVRTINNKGNFDLPFSSLQYYDIEILKFRF